MKKPRSPRTTGKTFDALFEPPRMGVYSRSIEKIRNRIANGLCPGCGVDPCKCKSTSKTRIVSSFYVSPSELSRGIISVNCTHIEHAERKEKYGEAYYLRWKENYRKRMQLKNSENNNESP